MNGRNTHHGIDYIEFTVHDLAVAKNFYASAFGWKFTDFGSGYSGIHRMDGSDGEMGGLALDEKTTCGSRNTTVPPLVVLYSSDLEASLSKVKDAGGNITKEMFSFPGGQRFEFTDPSGNTLAVWTKNGY